jgi:hypothetical protein
MHSLCRLRQNGIGHARQGKSKASLIKRVMTVQAKPHNIDDDTESQRSSELVDAR